MRKGGGWPPSIEAMLTMLRPEEGMRVGGGLTAGMVGAAAGDGRGETPPFPPLPGGGERLSEDGGEERGV